MRQPQLQLELREDQPTYAIETKSPKHAKLHYKGLINLKKLDRNTLIVFLYLLSNINRDTEAKWARLGKYYRNGLLVTARHQTHIAKELPFDQPAISRHLAKLKALHFIKPIAIEYIPRRKKAIPIPIYCLGEFDQNMGKNIEVHYYELSDMERNKLLKAKDFKFDHQIGIQF